MSHVQWRGRRGGLWQLLWLGVFRYCERCEDRDCPCDHITGIRWPWGRGFAWRRAWPVHRVKGRPPLSSTTGKPPVIFYWWRLGPLELRYLTPHREPA